MKNVSMLVWLTQLGLSVVVPLAGFILAAVWLRSNYSLGNWIIWVGIAIGVISAFNGFRFSLKAMNMMSDDKKDNELPASFNDHE